MEAAQADGTNRVIVIGGGLGGLASACTLAARGHDVELFEANDWLGGKAAPLEADGFRFDMGPTILTMPRVLRRIFDEAGRDLDEALTLMRLDPQWRCFFNDGAVLDLHENVSDAAQRISRFTGQADMGRGYSQFIEHARRLRDISERFFFWRPIDHISDMMDPAASFNISTLKDVMSMRMGRSVANTVRRYVPDRRVAQMLDHFTQYIGSSPFGSPAILCGIASMQVDEGVWYPKGGTRAVPEALVSLGRSLGVRFHTGRGVRRIHTSDQAVHAIETEDGERVPCGAVVSNMDALRTYRELLGERAETRDAPRDREPACSGVVLYLGLDRAYEHLAHHNFVFSDDPEAEFHAIYHKGEPAPDPTCYLAAPARSESAVAPEGGEALYVLVHTPYLRSHHDWSRGGALLTQYRQTILDKLKRDAGMPDLEQRIAHESILTPQDIHDRYRVLNGAIYGLASHGRFFGAFKPGNRRKLRGLYLAGGAAHPGAGMPMVMMSGWIAADALDRDGVVAPHDAPAAAGVDA